MDELVDQRLNALISMPLEQLRLLPSFAREEVVLGKKKVVIATHHETLGDNVHRLIVQASRERWGGITALVSASGYELSSAGNLRKLRDDELYDYT
jgi:hypothetical protein